MESLSPEWRNVLLEAGIKGPLLALRGQSVTPPAGAILRAFELCAFPPKVVLLGQDPYPRGANGLSFAFDGTTTPPSLKNIFTCLRTQGLVPLAGEPSRGRRISDAPLTCDLVGWAEQGVLLLNYALTTRPTVSGAHTDIWAPFTRALLEALAGLDSPPVFILLGEFAQRAADELLVMKFEWGHPSPLNRANQRPGERHFSNCDCFTLANEALVFSGQTPINWARTAGGGQEEAAKGPQGAALPVTLPGGPLSVFTDGAATKNGRPGCRASWAFFCAAAKYSEVGLVTETPSNNRGELTAIERALEWAATVPGADTDTIPSPAAAGADSPCVPVTVYTDSMYCINTITSFYPRWIQTDATEGKKNLDILARIALLIAARAGAPVEFVHVRGHKKEPTRGTHEHWLWDGNDTADKLCTQHLADTEATD